MDELLGRHNVGGRFGGLDEGENPPVAAPCGSPATTSLVSEEHVNRHPCSALTMKELKGALPEESSQGHASQLTKKKKKHTKKKHPMIEELEKLVDSDQHARRFANPQDRPPHLVEPRVSRSIGGGSAKGAPVVACRRKTWTRAARLGRHNEDIARRPNMYQDHVEAALRTYNNSNEIKFELLEITLKNLVMEAGSTYYHFNFSAKPKDAHSADGVSKLFFAEVGMDLQGDDNIRLCCMVGHEDEGFCYSCYRKDKYRDEGELRHPSNGGYHGESYDGSSESDEEFIASWEGLLSMK